MTDLFVTQCPHCQTRFRVNRAQLDAARGAVRCGSCLQVFNATQHLLGAAPKPPAAAMEPANKASPPAAPAPAPEPAQKPAAASAQPLAAGPWSHEDLDLGDLDLDNFDLDEELAKLDAQERLLQEQLEASEAKYTARAAAPAPKAAPAHPSSAFRHPQPPEEPALPPAKSLLVTPSGQGRRSEPEPPLDPLLTDDRDDDFQLVEMPATGDPATGDPFTGTSTTSPHRMPRPAPIDFSEPERRDERLFELADEPLQLDWQKPRKPWGRWLGWTLLNLLAAAALAGQYVWYHFDELARQDRYRPWFEQLCPALGCNLPPRVDIGQIKSSNLVVRSHPDFRGALVVDAILYNRAPFAQPFPLLELRFSDLNGQAIASRRFKPGEYLGGELAGQDEMPPQTPIHIALEILDPGPRAVNYSLSFHSPE